MQFGMPYVEQVNNNPLQFTEVYANKDASDTRRGGVGGDWGGKKKKKKKTIINPNFKISHYLPTVIHSYDTLSNLQPIQTHTLTTSSWNALPPGHLPVLGHRLPSMATLHLVLKCMLTSVIFIYCLIYDGQVKYFPLKYYTVFAVAQYASLLLITYVTANNIH